MTEPAMDGAEDALRRVRQANARLQRFLGRVGEALAGRRNFSADDVRAVAQTIREMAPVVSRAKQLRAAHPGLRDELEFYARHLAEADHALDRMRCVLLARRAQIEAQWGHLAAVRLWAGAWQQTQ
jgi:Lon protease-like protein